MSKELFLQMREIDAFELYAKKKEIIEKSEEFTNLILENGEITKQEAYARALRNATFWQNTAEKLKENFTEKDSFFGIELSPVNGRKMLQYSEDQIYEQLSKDLKEREELLKLAQTQEVADLYGNIVPKVSVKYAKDSLQVKY